MNTHAGPRLTAILAGQPFHLMNEEDKRSSAAVPNLNPHLRQLLNGTKRIYPAIPRGTCDVVFSLDGVRTWIECKLSQPHNGGNKSHWRFEDRNPNFEKHLGLVERDHCSGVRDVRDRLPTLDGSGHADRVGFVLVAYDSPRHSIDGAIQKFMELGGLHSWAHDVLISQPDPRDKAKAESARIQVLYWERLAVA